MSGLRIYNTLTRSVEPFEPIDGKRVRIYVCGLTPSAEAHLGHARSFLFFDVLRRYLEYRAYDVLFVQNVTDIDDRSIARSKETGEPWHEIVIGFYRTFKESMRLLGVREPDAEPYATQYVPQITGMIESLVAKGYAYVAKDGVYYRVAKFPAYGALSNRDVEELESGARIEVDEFKEDPLDFALWKFAKPGEPTWPSPWGDGRPGWHIECSAMSRTLLDPGGTGFEIHGGGADLIFPHHENEVAQSEPLMQRPPMSKYWIHGGLLLFDGRKMSKSLGNFEPLAQVVRRYDPQAIRLLFLQTGYSKVMNYTETAMSAAGVTLANLKRGYRALANAANGVRAESYERTFLSNEIETALDDDMNTAVALSKVLAAAASPDGFVGAHTASGPDDANAAGRALAELHVMLRILGLEPDETWLRESEATLPADFLERLRGELNGTVGIDATSAESALALVIDARARARAEKNWAESDRLRDVLARCGVAVKDSKDGTTWSVAG